MSAGRKLLLGLILTIVIGIGAFNLLYERYEVGPITYGSSVVVTDSPAGSITRTVSTGTPQVTYAYRLRPEVAASISSAGSPTWLIFIALIIFWEAITKLGKLKSFWINYGGVIAISAVCFIMGWINVFITFAFIVFLGFVLAIEHKDLVENYVETAWARTDKLLESLLKRDREGER